MLESKINKLIYKGKYPASGPSAPHHGQGHFVWGRVHAQAYGAQPPCPHPKRNRDPKPTAKTTDVYGYPTNHTAYNQIWNVQHKLPLYTKTAKSSSYHCAGYYIIKFDKIWCKSSSPKLITLQRYQFLGPFKNKIDQAATLRKCLEEA